MSVKEELHEGDMQVILARYFNSSSNVIVPNVSWGLGLHEIDLLILTSSNYAWEIEIKISISDLRADKKKHHAHYSNKIKRLYFAIPEKLQEGALPLIPERAGLLLVAPNHYVRLIKAPIINKAARKFTDKEVQKLYELAAIRLWSLKEVVYRLQRELKGKIK